MIFVHANKPADDQSYLVYSAKNTRAEGFNFLQLRGPQDTGVNFCTFLPRTQRLKALPKKTKKQNKNDPQVQFLAKEDHEQSL